MTSWLEIPEIGIGTMMWGTTPLDRKINGQIAGDESLLQIRARATQLGILFIDTAEGYGGGSCEKRIGDNRFPAFGYTVATKFLPTIWRWSERAVPRAIRASNVRLGIERCPLCFIHTPVHFRSPDVWIRGGARAIREGVLERLGVSNFDAEELRRACRIAREEGIGVAANQILFSLLTYGSASVREIVAACRELDVALIGYGVLGQGLLTDGLTRDKAARSRYSRIASVGYEDLVPLRREIGRIAHRRDCDMAQVCIAWALQKNTTVLVGMRSAEHLEKSAAAREIALTEEELRTLDELALDRATFRRARSRRLVFVVLISLLIIGYRISRIIPELPAGGANHEERKCR